MNEYGKRVAKKMEDYMGDPNSVSKEINDIQNAIEGVEVRGALAAGVAKSFNKSKNAEEKAEEAHEITQDLLDETFDSAALEANFEQRLDEAIENLQPEWTTFKNDVTTQLIQIDDKVFYEGITNNKLVKPLMVIIDDDGHPAVWDLLKPIVESEQVPITLAVITNRVERNDGTSLTLEQLKELQKLGFEIVSHTHTHKRLSELSDEEQHYEIKTSKRFLQKHGFTGDILVYPFGSADENTQEIARKYVRAGVYIDYGQSRLNTPPILQYRLERVYYNLDDGTNRVDLVKQKIDETIEKNALLIVGTHCHYEGFDPEGLKECIVYAKQQGVPIVTMSEAINLYGNIIDLPDFRVGATGTISSTSIGKTTVARGTQGINGNTPLSEFNDGITISSHTTAATYEGMPVSSSQIMITVKPQSTYLSFQEVTVLANKHIYRRYQVGGEWGPWERIDTVNLVQSGTDGNSYYVKLPDGTMICTLETTVDITTEISPFFRSTERIISYPAKFVSPPSVQVTAEYSDLNTFAFGVLLGGNATAVRIRGISNASVTSVKLIVTAIGRWK